MVLEHPMAASHGLVELAALSVPLCEEQEGFHRVRTRWLAGAGVDSLSLRIPSTHLNVLPVVAGSLVRRALLVVVRDGPLVATNGAHRPVQALVAEPERIPHSSVVWLQRCSLAIVVQGVREHLKDLVGLAEAVPRAKVPRIHVDGAPVRFNRRPRVLEL
eukprot:scaffold733_cov267-Pinguiococcus_pyrenoidosus.AAC.50